MEALQNEVEEITTGSSDSGGGDTEVELSSISKQPSSDWDTSRDICFACSNRAKYRCPLCRTSSCSLPCVVLHKERTGCCGKRPKTDDVGIRDYSEKTLLRDYRFLEESSRLVENCARLMARQADERFRGSRVSTTVLRQKCAERGIMLKVMPSTLSRRRSNTTQLTRKSKNIQWKVEWKMTKADVTFVDAKVADNTVLRAMVLKLLAIRPNEPERAKLKEVGYFPWPDLRDLVILFEDAETPANNKAYYELDLDKSLWENLTHKTVVEFPTFHVLTKMDLKTEEFKHFERRASEHWNPFPNFFNRGRGEKEEKDTVDLDVDVEEVEETEEPPSKKQRYHEVSPQPRHPQRPQQPQQLRQAQQLQQQLLRGAATPEVVKID